MQRLCIAFLILLETCRLLWTAVSWLPETVEHETESLVAADTVWIPEKANATIHESLQQQIGAPSNSPLHYCPATAQVRLTTHTDNSWILHAYDADGNAKTVGGDEFYIVYGDEAVAFVHDNEDGSYSLDFVERPIQPNVTTSDLIIHFQFTCGMGQLGPPQKVHWATGGHMGWSETWKEAPRPSIRPVIPPSSGRLKVPMLGFGDSTMGNLFKRNGTHHFRPTSETYWRQNIGMELNTTTLPIWIKELNRKDKVYLSDPNATILVGSFLWDIVEDAPRDDEFTNHLYAVRQFLQYLKENSRATIVWKSGSAVHPHRIGRCRRKCTRRAKYVSTSRAQRLALLHKKLMAELGIPFLDLYDVFYLSDSLTVEGDSRHYVAELNEQVLEWVLPSQT